MIDVNVITEAPGSVRCSAWLGVFVVCFVLGFVLIGMPLGRTLALRRWRREFPKALIEHVPKLGERGVPFVIYLAAQLCVLYGLLFQKGKLLVEKLLLKAESNPATQQNAENRRADSRKENFVWHKSVLKTPNDPSSATRPTTRYDCNSDAMAGFAAAHG